MPLPRGVRLLAAALLVSLLTGGCTLATKVEHNIAIQEAFDNTAKNMTDSSASVNWGVPQRIAEKLLGALLILLCAVSWYRIHTGQPWLAVLKEWAIWAALAYFLLAGLRGGKGIDLCKWIPTAANYLASDVIEPPKDWLKQYDDYSKKLGENYKNLSTSSPLGLAALLDADVREAAMNFFGSQAVLMMTALNALFLHGVAAFMSLSYAILLVVYRIIFPFMIPLLVLEQTRSVFVGWLRQYVAVCCWPVLIAVIRKAMALMTWTYLHPFLTGTGGGLDQIEVIVFGSIFLFIVNLTFTLMFIAVPAVASKVVNGAQEHIKAGFF